MTQELIERVFAPAFANPILAQSNDFAAFLLPLEAQLHGSLAISTDSHIVSPLFFAGGDIGRLAVCGTVNDVSMSGAQPLYLTAGFIIEEGLPVRHLEAVQLSRFFRVQDFSRTFEVTFFCPVERPQFVMSNVPNLSCRT